jgi:Kinesin motor domain
VVQVCCGHHTFSFDQVFGGGGHTPAKLYGDCVEPLVQGIFGGYNATIFAYGQTGSGKTFTMGSHYSPPQPARGVIPDALESMFAKIDAAKDTAFRMRVGFIEIHKVCPAAFAASADVLIHNQSMLRLAFERYCTTFVNLNSRVYPSQ